MDFVSFNSICDNLKDFLVAAGEVATEDSGVQNDLIPIAWQRNDGSIVFFDDFGLNPRSVSQCQTWGSTPDLPFLKVGIDIVVNTKYGVLVIHDDRKDYRRFPGGKLNFNETYKLVNAVERKIFGEILYVIRKDKSSRIIPKNIDSNGLSLSIDNLKIFAKDFEKSGYLQYLGYSVDNSLNQLSFVFGWDIPNFGEEISVYHQKRYSDNSFASYSFNSVNENAEITAYTSGQHGFITYKSPIPDEDFHKTVLDYFNKKLLKDIAVI